MQGSKVLPLLGDSEMTLELPSSLVCVRRDWLVVADLQNQSKRKSLILFRIVLIRQDAPEPLKSTEDL